MNQNKRIHDRGRYALLVIVGIILGVDYLAAPAGCLARRPRDMPPGSIPIFMDGKFVSQLRARRSGTAGKRQLYRC